MERLGITNYYINTIVTTLQNPVWEVLLQRYFNIIYQNYALFTDILNRIGSDAMLHLLSETSLFICLPNDCYCQMTGKTIVSLTPSTAGPYSEKKKRQLDPVAELREGPPSKRIKVMAHSGPPVAIRCVRKYAVQCPYY